MFGCPLRSIYLFGLRYHYFYSSMSTLSNTAQNQQVHLLNYCAFYEVVVLFLVLYITFWRKHFFFLLYLSAKAKIFCWERIFFKSTVGNHLNFYTIFAARVTLRPISNVMAQMNWSASISDVEALLLHTH